VVACSTVYLICVAILLGTVAHIVPDVFTAVVRRHFIIPILAKFLGYPESSTFTIVADFFPLTSIAYILIEEAAFVAWVFH